MSWLLTAHVQVPRVPDVVEWVRREEVEFVVRPHETFVEALHQPPVAVSLPVRGDGPVPVEVVRPVVRGQRLQYGTVVLRRELVDDLTGLL